MCEGKNCYSVNGLYHSNECIEEHEEAIESGVVEISYEGKRVKPERKEYEH